MRRPLKTLSFPVSLAGLDADEHRRRVNEIVAEKRAKYPHVTKGTGFRKGVEQRVAREMREAA